MVRIGIQGCIKNRIERNKNKEQHQEIPINSAPRKNIIYVDSQHTILKFPAVPPGGTGDLDSQGKNIIVFAR